MLIFCILLGYGQNPPSGKLKRVIQIEADIVGAVLCQGGLGSNQGVSVIVGSQLVSEKFSMVVSNDFDRNSCDCVTFGCRC